MILEELDTLIGEKKKDFSPCLTPNTTINSKLVTDANIKDKTIKHLEENKRFYSMQKFLTSQKTINIKEKIVNYILSKLKMSAYHKVRLTKCLGRLQIRRKYS